MPPQPFSRADVHIAGPFFTSKRQRAVNRMVGREITLMTREARENVRVQLYKGHGLRTGELKRSVVSRKFGQLVGMVFIKPKGWKAFIKATFIEGVSRRNETTRFKGFHIFRNERERVRAVAQRRAETAARQVVKELN